MTHRKQTWKRSIILFAFLLALVPATAFSQILGTEDIHVISSQGNTTVERMSQGQIEIVTQGLQSRGTVACNGDSQCLATGLDDADLVIDQNMRLFVDTATMTVSGETRGQIQGAEEFHVITHEIGHNIVGDATCAGSAPNPCEILQLDIQVVSIVLGQDGTDLLSQLEQAFTVMIDLSDNESPSATWTANGMAIKIEQPPG